MTREQAAAEAQERNVTEFRRTGELRTVWAEYEAAPGRWEVGLYEKGSRPRWRRVTRAAVDFVLEPDPVQGDILPDMPRRVWRRRR